MDVQSLSTLPIARITPSHSNPRKHFDKDKLAELTESVSAHGILQPILVRPRKDGEGWELVAGERRYRAALSAGLEEIPAVVRELDDKQTLEVQVIENLQRADLSPLEEANGYQLLIKQHGYTAEALAEKIHKSRSYIYGRMKLTALGKAGRVALEKGEISDSVALLLARIPDEKLQAEALKDIAGTEYNSAMSYRRAAEYIQRNHMLRLGEAPWDLADESLTKAGPCTTCPMRTGNQPELFGDVKSADVCTSPVCFKSKADAHWKRLKVEAEASGRMVFNEKQAKAEFDKYSVHGLRYGSTYVLLSQACELDPKRRSYQQLLGKTAPPSVLAQNPFDGKVHELLDKKAALKAIKAKGHNFSVEREAAMSPERKAENERYKREEAKRERAAAIEQEIVDAIAAKILALPNPPQSLWRLIVEQSLVDSGNIEELLEERSVVLTKDYKKRDREIRDFLAKLSDAELLVAGIEDAFRPSHYSDEERKENRDRALKLLRLDRKKIVTKAAANFKEKEKKAGAGVCRECGCTEDAACEGGCSWVDTNKTLCSACNDEE